MLRALNSSIFWVNLISLFPQVDMVHSESGRKIKFYKNINGYSGWIWVRKICSGMNQANQNPCHNALAVSWWKAYHMKLENSRYGNLAYTFHL